MAANSSTSCTRSLGGGINSVVRSGGNLFHFDAFYYFRDSAMGALDPVAKAAGATQTFEQRQQFGVVIRSWLITITAAV